MSLEFVLEKYPYTTELRDGRTVEVRPLRHEDCEAIKAFYPAVPDYERMFIKHPIIDASLMEQWCKHIDFECNLPLLVLHEGMVIGEGTLHRRNGGWKKHIGLITILSHPDCRGIGLSELLVDELVDLARFSGLKKLEAELNGEREVAIKSLHMVGFGELLRLKDYLEDGAGQPHDYVLMGMDLITDEEYAGAG